MLNLILALEGMASMGVQFLTMRLTTPYVGSSVVPTSLIITTILLFLALGYRSGGRFDGDKASRVIKNLVFSAALVAVGLSEICVQIFLSSGGLPGLLGINTFVVFPLYLLLFIAPVAFLLAQLIPLVIGMNESADSADKKAGDSYFVSTIGNVAGGLFISVVVLYFFGSNAAVVLIVSVLIALAAYLDRKRKSNAAGYIAVILVALIVNDGGMTPKDTDNSRYANRSIVMSDWGMHLVLNNSNSSGLGKNGEYFSYIQYMRDLLKDGDKVVTLGAGGFTLGKDLGKDIDLTYVDIDSVLQEFAEKYFLKEEIQGKFVVSDARVFAKRSKETFDVVVVDAYSSSLSVPEHIKTIGFYNDLKNILKPGGRVVINLIHNTRMGRYDYAAAKTIHSAYDFCEVVNVSTSNGQYANYIYDCRVANHKPKAFTDGRVSIFNSPSGF